MIAPRTFKEDASFRTAIWNNLVITDVKGPVEAAGIRDMTDAFHKLHEIYPARVVGLSIVRANVNVGAGDIHAETARCVRGVSAKLLHAAIVLEDQGMIAQLMRSFIRTLNSIVRGSRLSIAKDLDEAANTLVPLIVAAEYSSKLQIKRELLEAVASVRGP